LDSARFFSAYRGRKTVAHRKEFIIRAITAGHTLTDIADFLPLSYESVRRGASHRTHITLETQKTICYNLLHGLVERVGAIGTILR